MKILSLDYKEGVEDLVKHGLPRFYIEIEVDFADLPKDTSYRSDGVEVWLANLSPLGVLPDGVQRLGGWDHTAQLFWHDRQAAMQAFE